MESRRKIVYAGSEIISDEMVDRSWEYVRHHRTKWLNTSDRFSAMKDRFTEDEWNAFLEYRQKLRDLPTMFENPNDASDNWPSRPDFMKNKDE